MRKVSVCVAMVVLFGCGSALAQGPCSQQSSKLACVIPEEYGATTQSLENVFFDAGGHPFHFVQDFTQTLAPLTADIGRQANLLPLASPSSGLVLTYDPTLKTFVTSTDSLGPVLGERAETVGRHRLFLGFSYQYFDFDKIDGVNLRDIPAVLTHTNDSTDNSTPTNPVTCSITTNQNLNGCAFVRDIVSTVNSIDLQVNQYTAYVTFGLTRRIDLSMVIPFENVRMSLTSDDTIIPGSNGFYTPAPGSPDSMIPNQNTTHTNGAPYFFHLFKNCPNTSPPTGLSGLAPACLNHVFPDPSFAGSGSSRMNSASGIGDVVARVKWNLWEGERAGFAAGLDVRFPSGDVLNYLGSGSYGVKPFAVFSYRARVAPHVLLGYEWNTKSIADGNLLTGVKGTFPNDFTYAVGADAWVTKWLTGAFDIVGQEVFGAETVAVAPQQFLANCGTCTANPTPAYVTMNNLVTSANTNYSVTNASMGVKVRPFSKVSRLVFTANLLVRLDDGGLRSKPAPLVGVGYTF